MLIFWKFKIRKVNSYENFVNVLDFLSKTIS